MKVKFFEDESTASQILNSTTALESKQLSKEICDYDQETWLPASKVICEDGIAAKFLQNQGLANELLKKGTKTLVECSYDDH